jgi:hypothetical protein
VELTTCFEQFFPLCAYAYFLWSIINLLLDFKLDFVFLFARHCPFILGKEENEKVENEVEETKGGINQGKTRRRKWCGSREERVFSSFQ